MIGWLDCCLLMMVVILLLFIIKICVFLFYVLAIARFDDCVGLWLSLLLLVYTAVFA